MSWHYFQGQAASVTEPRCQRIAHGHPERNRIVKSLKAIGQLVRDTLHRFVGGIGNDRLFSIEVTDKPKWFQFRRRISRSLVWCAKLIYPRSPEVATFMYEVMVEQAIAGSVVIRQATGEVIYPANT